MRPFGSRISGDERTVVDGIWTYLTGVRVKGSLDFGILERNQLDIAMKRGIKTEQPDETK